MTEQRQLAPVTAAVTVPVSPTRAFGFFTVGHNDWRTPGHFIGAVEPEVVVLEPFVGGRWFERAPDEGHGSGAEEMRRAVADDDGWAKAVRLYATTIS